MRNVSNNQCFFVFALLHLSLFVDSLRQLKILFGLFGLTTKGSANCVHRMLQSLFFLFLVSSHYYTNCYRWAYIAWLRDIMLTTEIFLPMQIILHSSIHYLAYKSTYPLAESWELEISNRHGGNMQKPRIFLAGGRLCLVVPWEHRLWDEESTNHIW